MNQQEWADLLTSAGSTPYLEGALCRGRPEVFDLELKADAELVEYARHQCRRCSALKPCEAWVAATPAHLRPVGVVAGELLGPPPAPPRTLDPAADEAWLARYLAHHGPTPASEVMTAGRAEGIPPARLRAARRAIAPSTVGRGDTGPWRLPDPDEVAA